MTREQIIALAREAGFEFTSTNHLKLSGADWHTEEWVHEYLERFAALVAAAEREECARLCDVEIARVKPIYSVTAENCAKAIRSRA